MRTSVLVSLALAASLVSSGAFAATIVNHDKTARWIEITEAGKTRKVEVEPNKTLTGLCKNGCSVSLGSQKVNLKDTGSAAIRDNSLVM